jgi:ferric-chelate reductase
LILILSIVHVAGRVYVNVPNSDPRGEGQAFVRWGIVGFALFVFMILGAARPIRNRWYQ